MLKLLGAVMIIGSCSAIGIFMSAETKRHVAALKSFISAFQIIKAEVVFRAMPITKILYELEKEPGEAQFFFKTLLQDMEESHITFHNAFELRYGMLLKTGLQPAEAEIVKGGARTLGRYDMETQREGLSAAIASLEASLASAGSESAQKGRLYRAVGISAGIMLALITL